MSLRDRLATIIGNYAMSVAVDGRYSVNPYVQEAIDEVVEVVEKAALTDEELEVADKRLGADFFEEHDEQKSWLMDRQNIAKAQLQKVIKAIKEGK